jgi:hypothetical protein
MSDYDITFCASCKEYYATHLQQCPRCNEIACASSKKAVNRGVVLVPAMKPSKQAYLTFTQYKALSSNTVSQAEWKRYTHLFAMVQEGTISNLELQVCYDLIPGTRMKPIIGKPYTQSSVTYSPDFRYVWNGYTIVEEYKGMRFTKKTKTPNPRTDTAARLKHKLFMHKYLKHFQSGEWLFIISAWHPKERDYTLFNSNGTIIDFDFEQQENAA